jgi:hypothetical protein
MATLRVTFDFVDRQIYCPHCKSNDNTSLFEWKEDHHNGKCGLAVRVYCSGCGVYFRIELDAEFTTVTSTPVIGRSPGGVTATIETLPEQLAK